MVLWSRPCHTSRSRRSHRVGRPHARRAGTQQGVADDARAVAAEETLEAITRAALETVPGFDHVGISITHRDGTIETKSATDQLVWELDQLQYGLREGPCYESTRGRTVLFVEEARHEQRWPRYMPEAVRRGLRAQLAVGLYDDERSLGGLNLYSTQSDRIHPEAVGIAELFAVQAAIAMGRSRNEVQLNEALESRKVIGQAIGLIMERYRMGEDRAFQFLIRASSTGNVKLRDVAAELVRMANDRAPQPRNGRQRQP